jgi:hypothetical protein
MTTSNPTRIRTRRASQPKSAVIPLDLSVRCRRVINVMAIRNGISIEEQITMLVRTHPAIA